jgi:hypothetical protein
VTADLVTLGDAARRLGVTRPSLKNARTRAARAGNPFPPQIISSRGHGPAAYVWPDVWAWWARRPLAGSTPCPTCGHRATDQPNPKETQ